MPVITRSQSKKIARVDKVVYKLVYLPVQSNNPRKVYGIATMMIPEGALTNESREVENQEFAIFRCDRAIVQTITNLDEDNEYDVGYSIYGIHGKSIEYRVGETVHPHRFERIDTQVFGAGLYYFNSKEMAKKYYMWNFNINSVYYEGYYLPIRFNPREYLEHILENGKNDFTLIYNSNGLLCEIIGSLRANINIDIDKTLGKYYIEIVDNRGKHNVIQPIIEYN